MLYRLILQNYKSFRERTEFSMIPSSDSTHVAFENSPIPVLRDAAIYGPNASGKSNLIKALDFIQDFVLDNSVLENHRNDAFKFDKDYLSAPSAFVIEIKVANILYQYGFVVSFMTSIVVKEWLSYYDSTSRKWIKVFVADDKLELNGDVDSSNKERARIYNEDNRKNQNLLLLTVLSDKALKEDVLKTSVQHVFQWVKNLVILFPNSVYNLMGAVAHDIDAVNQLYKKYFKAFGIDIDKIELSNIAVESLHLPTGLISDMKQTLKKDDRVKLVMLHTPKDDYLVSLNDLGEIQASKVGFLHNDDHTGILLSKSEESDGTNRLMDLIPLLGMAIKKNRVVVIDEINRSLHSALTHQFIKVFFQQTSDSSESQLIFSTHAILLLDSGMFGKKEIWFLDKRDGVSSLYPLDKFKLPADMKDIGQNYMLGRFDAIPKI